MRSDCRRAKLDVIMLICFFFRFANGMLVYGICGVLMNSSDNSTKNYILNFGMFSFDLFGMCCYGFQMMIKI